MHTQAPANIKGDHALQSQGHLGPVRLARIVRRSLVQTAHFKRGLRTGKVKAIVRAKRLRCSIFTGGRRLVCAHNRRFGHRRERRKERGQTGHDQSYERLPKGVLCILAHRLSCAFVCAADGDLLAAVETADAALLRAR